MSLYFDDSLASYPENICRRINRPWVPKKKNAGSVGRLISVRSFEDMNHIPRFHKHIEEDEEARSPSPPLKSLASSTLNPARSFIDNNAACGTPRVMTSCCNDDSLRCPDAPRKSERFIHTTRQDSDRKALSPKRLDFSDGDNF